MLCIVKPVTRNPFQHFISFGLPGTNQLQIVKINCVSCFRTSFLSFLSVSCFSSMAPTHPSEGLVSTVSESLKFTWQAVAPSKAANVTLLLRSQTSKAKIIHIWRSTSRMTSYFFPAPPPSHPSLLLWMMVHLVNSLHMMSDLSRKKVLEKAIQNTASYMKSDPTPVWVHSSEWKCDTSSVCVWQILE